MNIAATFSIFCFILVAACSRLPQPTVQHGQTIQPQDHSDPQHRYTTINLGTLSCEPKGLTQLPEGVCIGTPNAYPTMEDKKCVCKNEDYVPIPTKAGHTCIHLFSILETLRVVHQKIRDQGVTDADSEMPLIDIADETLRAIQSQIEEGEYDDDDVTNSEEAIDDPTARNEAIHREQQRRIATDLSVLAKDLRKADRLLRERTEPAKLNRTFKYIQIVMEQYLRIDGAPDCLQIKGLASRRKLFAYYPPMRP